MFSTKAAIDSLVLEEVSPDHYRAGNLPHGHVVFGGQLMGQSIVAALLGQDGKTVKTLHTVFARAGKPGVPLDIVVERIHSGRRMASSTVTISQGDRLCTRSSVLMSADEPDFIRHADEYKLPPVPAEGAGDADSWQVEIVGGIDIGDPEAVGPPELDAWSRWPGVTDDPGANQALLAFATDGFLIGTAMRPHQGVGQSQAHVTISTGVLSHTMTFHEPTSAGEWLLLVQRSKYAGHGRSYGQGDVFQADGRLVASFVQDSMIAPMAAAAGGGRL